MTLIASISTVSILCTVALVLAVLPQVYAGELFPWHPILMGLGFLGFMCEGIIAAYRLRPTDGPPRVAAIQNHMWVQIASTISILLGFWAIYYNKTLHNKQHFKSLHGKVGLFTTILSLAAPTLGVLSFKKLGLLTKLPAEWHPAVKWLHRLIGAITWVSAIFTMQLPLPHRAVFEGFLCRAWQAASIGLGVGMLAMLRKPAPGKPVLPSIDFTGVQGTKHH
jgi:cytochrome b-561 domain-containing protein 2